MASTVILSARLSNLIKIHFSFNFCCFLFIFLRQADKQLARLSNQHTNFINDLNGYLLFFCSLNDSSKYICIPCRQAVYQMGYTECLWDEN